ncbi:hypothetical protein KY285_023896 [Solanum tuberosum]|nr:hypothetical protein KY289_025776 [Solanum tuberosum]KAH0676095.1 hypothetical protein KY285_023896 [Solanum tuberosum]
MIQKDIVTTCKIEAIKAIIQELNGDYFSLLVDESFDVSCKEEIANVLRYVDRMGFVMERLIDIVHVQDTSALSLNGAIVNVLAQHSLSLSHVRGQCYDRSSNMKGEMNSLKMLIRQERIQEALDMGELTTCIGLYQELGLIRAGDTRWGSHYKSFSNFILLFGSIVDVLDALVVDAYSIDERAKATGYLEACQTFKIAFMLHLMRETLGITDELNKSLQKKEQDIANVMLLVEVAKRRLQMLRDDGWDALINKIIDWQLQELNDSFNEVTNDLLHGVACLNPFDSFSSFNIIKIMRMAKLYLDDFDEFSMNALENQLATYIINVRDMDERFSNLNELCDLSRKLVETKKNLNFPLVFRLVKFALLLLVVTASIERAFSAMKFINNDLRNQMNDELLSD